MAADSIMINVGSADPTSSQIITNYQTKMQMDLRYD